MDGSKKHRRRCDTWGNLQSSPPLITDAGCLADAQRNSFISPVYLITYLRENQAGFQGCRRPGLCRGILITGRLKKHSSVLVTMPGCVRVCQTGWGWETRERWVFWTSWWSGELKPDGLLVVCFSHIPNKIFLRLKFKLNGRLTPSFLII